MTVTPFPGRRTLMDRIAAARKQAKVIFLPPRQEPAERESWAQHKLDDALGVYRTVFGAQALVARLQRALADEQQLVTADQTSSTGPAE